MKHIKVLAIILLIALSACSPPSLNDQVVTSGVPTSTPASSIDATVDIDLEEMLATMPTTMPPEVAALDVQVFTYDGEKPSEPIWILLEPPFGYFDEATKISFTNPSFDGDAILGVPGTGIFHRVSSGHVAIVDLENGIQMWFYNDGEHSWVLEDSTRRE